jgi:flagellar protein FliS
MNPTELAYRRTAVEGASGFGLLIALYDTLAGDLRRATSAQRYGDIQNRCKEVNHALLVVGYLEDWIDRESGGELGQKLLVFYSDLRSTLIEAQVKQSAALLEQKVAEILAIRGTWQELELRATTVLDSPDKSLAQQYPKTPHMREEANGYSWSA